MNNWSPLHIITIWDFGVIISSSAHRLWNMVCFIPCQRLRNPTENPSQSISFGEWMNTKSSICGSGHPSLSTALFYVGVLEWAAVGFKVTPLGQHLWSWLMTNTCEWGGERLCHNLLNRWQTSPFGCSSHHSSCQILCPSSLLVTYTIFDVFFWGILNLNFTCKAL